MENLDFKHLQYAIEVEHYGSLTKAAQMLFLAQPNLSRAIGELEQSLGFPLFIRTKRGMTPTPQGKRFLKEAESMLSHLEQVAQECRQEQDFHVHFSCVPSSLFINTLLGVARENPKWKIQCEEYYNCLDLFDNVVKGASQAAFLTFGTDMREDLFSYFRRRKLSYHPLMQSPAYGVVHRSSRLYHPDEVPPSINYEDATLMLNVTYLEPIGIPFRQWNFPLPQTRGVCQGVGRAGNLDMLESMEDLVMLSCHVHSKIMARNDLAAVPLHPECMSYEYGYVTRTDRKTGPELQELFGKIEEAVRLEFQSP